MTERLVDDQPVSGMIGENGEFVNELRRAARHGLIFRWAEACEHLSQARGHLEQAMREAKGEEPPDGPQTPLRKEGEF